MPVWRPGFALIVEPLNAYWIGRDTGHCGCRRRAIRVADPAIEIKPVISGRPVICTSRLRKVHGLMVLGLHLLGHKNMLAANTVRCREKRHRQNTQHEHQENSAHPAILGGGS